MKTNKAGNKRGLHGNQGRIKGSGEKTDKINIRFRPELKKQLKEIAQSKSMTLTALVEKALSYYIDTEFKIYGR